MIRNILHYNPRKLDFLRQSMVRLGNAKKKFYPGCEWDTPITMDADPQQRIDWAFEVLFF